jgi:acetylornithine deacetylase/succinyl-diaminopimelate desuccinylase-like protein
MTLPSISRRAVKWTAAAMLTGAVLLVVASRRDESPLRQPGPDLVPRLSALDSHIRSLQGMGARSTLEQQWRAARWIAERFEEAGLDTTIEPYEEAGQSWPNVVARIAGARPDGDVVMVTAHLDSIARDSQAAPGADDNASGVAVAIQAAHDIVGLGLDRPVVFAVFSNEERGAVGSRSYARAARTRGAGIKAVLNLDILGYNRPPTLGLLLAMGAHASAKYKLKAAWRAVRNYVIGWRESADRVAVAGRDAYRALVERVGGAMGTVPGLSIKTVVGDGCG